MKIPGIEGVDPEKAARLRDDCVDNERETGIKESSLLI